MVDLQLFTERLEDVGGILTASDAPGGYWGELEQDLFLNLLRQVEEGTNFDHEVLGFFENQERQDLYPYITDVSGRCAWHSLLSKRTEGGVAVDVGAGLGAITQFFSGHYETVYSIEACRERCLFLLQRKIKMKLDNVTIIHGCIRRLPFADGSVDLLACNGVLEWIGAGTTGDVRQVQLQFLREIHRVLKDDGILYVGIENRIALNYFLGAVDHSGMKFTSLMPRRVADMWMTMKDRSRDRSNFSVETKSSGYRTYTYTKNGYDKLLREAGFTSNKFYSVDPSYDLPVIAVPESMETEPARSFISFFRPGASRFVPRGLCSNYFIFAGKREVSQKLAHIPVYYGFYDTCTLDRDFITRTSLTGTVRMEPLVHGKTLLDLSGIEKRALVAPCICESLKDFVRQPHAVRADERCDDLGRILKETVGTIIGTSDLDMMMDSITSFHTGKTYHGDFWVGNIIKTQGGGFVAIDPEPQPFGSLDLDLVDFVTDYVINMRNKEFALDIHAILEEVTTSTEKELFDLFRLSLVRQVIRYSPFHRSNVLIYRYKDLLRDFERSQGASLMDLI